jgi:hypothetical protein
MSQQHSLLHETKDISNIRGLIQNFPD